MVHNQADRQVIPSKMKISSKGISYEKAKIEVTTKKTLTK